MKKFSIVLLALLLSLVSLSAFAGDRHDRGSRHGYGQYDGRYEQYDRRDDRRNRYDRYRHDHYRYRHDRAPVVIYRQDPYRSYGYGNPYRSSRYDYYGNRYVHHRGRYYDQCSSSDRNAAALAGVVLGGAIGSQANQRDPQVGAIVGATIGGLIANEVVGGRCR